MPSRSRTLSLRREALAALTTNEMEAVVGGSPTWQPSCMNDCPTLDQCPTIPIRECKIYMAQLPDTSILEGTAR